METNKIIKSAFYYACCPYCKNILIQAHIVDDGHIICPKCNKTIHIDIQNGKVVTNIEKE